jgi:hypothetical protein
LAQDNSTAYFDLCYFEGSRFATIKTGTFCYLWMRRCWIQSHDWRGTGIGVDMGSTSAWYLERNVIYGPFAGRGRGFYTGGYGSSGKIGTGGSNGTLFVDLEYGCYGTYNNWITEPSVCTYIGCTTDYVEGSVQALT